MGVTWLSFGEVAKTMVIAVLARSMYCTSVPYSLHKRAQKQVHTVLLCNFFHRNCTVKWFFHRISIRLNVL